MTPFLPVMGLAVVDGVNPTAILVTILLTLRSPSRGVSPVRPVTAHLAGIVAANFALGVALVLGIRSVLAAAGGVLRGPTAYRIQLVAGLALLTIGVRTPTRPRKPRQERSLDRSSGRLLLGMGVTLVELTTALPYLAAVGRGGASASGRRPVAATGGVLPGGVG